MDRIPLLLDTDIGSDIDDAVALAYLLRQPRCELLGVTTVSGEPERRAALASAICRAAGREEVPIHVGVGPPILVSQKQPRAPQYDALSSRWPHHRFEDRNTAVGFLQHTIRSRPGEITLLTIGPLTNVGLLFALDPEISGMLKQLVIMGGWYYHHEQPHEEWNILCDPHAAARVFDSPLSRLTAVGIDVTEQCRMDAHECRRRFQNAGGPLSLVDEMTAIWLRGGSPTYVHDPLAAITFHDPLAAALVFDESLCSLERCHVAVDLCETPGRTTRSSDPRPAYHLVAAAVQPERFFSEYFGTIEG